MQAPPVVVMPCGVAAIRRLSDSVCEAGFSTQSSSAGYRPASACGKAQHSAARGVSSYALSTPTESEASSGGAAEGMSLSAWKSGSSSAGQRRHRSPGGEARCSLHACRRLEADAAQSASSCVSWQLAQALLAPSTSAVGGGLIELNSPHPRRFLMCACACCLLQTRQGLNTAAGAWQLRPCQQQSSTTKRHAQLATAAAPCALPAHTGSCR